MFLNRFGPNLCENLRDLREFFFSRRSRRITQNIFWNGTINLSVMIKFYNLRISYVLLLLALVCFDVTAQKDHQKFTIVAFYTGKNDKAHVSFVHEANKWFSELAAKNKFAYDSTNDWTNMNPDFLAKYNVVMFLDTRPEKPDQRIAFEQYMKNGGAWIGFHFAAFALTPSDFPQNWDWYHNEFLGSGEYMGNTWRTTSAILLVEDKKHPVTRTLPEMFTASPNEWYSWKNELRANSNIKVLLSIDPSSFPLGTGPKQWEIWHKGDFPVVWTNLKYRMLYINMGHNDIDYEGGTNKELSLTFKNKTQNELIINTLRWYQKGGRKIRN